MKNTLRIFLLLFAAVLGTWAMPAQARDRDRDHRGYDRGRSYYSNHSYYRGGRSYYSNRSYYRGGRGYGYYGPRYGYYRRPYVVYGSPYYYDDYYYGRPYYSRPAISIGVGGRHGFFRGIF